VRGGEGGRALLGVPSTASAVVLRPGQVSDRTFVDEAAHRASLPAIYNSYQRTDSDPAALKAMEDERCILFPLFSTSLPALRLPDRQRVLRCPPGARR